MGQHVGEGRKDGCTLKLGFWSILVSVALAALGHPASGDAPIDRYFALRRQHHADRIHLSQIKADPESCKGMVFEVRGMLSGIAKTGSQTSVILNSETDGCLLVTAGELPDITPGCRVCVLVQVGEGCTVSLSDLKLVALAYQGEVAAREQRAAEAQAKKKAAYAVSETRQWPANQERFGRGDRAASRSGRTLSANQLVAAYRKAIKSFNRKLSDADADLIAQSILGFSIKYQVDPRLVVAVILAESHFRPEATSRKGAMGLGQLMPGTAAGLGVSDPYDPVENVGGSIRLIRGHLDTLSGNALWNELTWHDLALALASYNAGSGAVRKYGGVPPYRETRNYINRVFSLYRRLCGYE